MIFTDGMSEGTKEVSFRSLGFDCREFSSECKPVQCMKPVSQVPQVLQSGGRCRAVPTAESLKVASSKQ